MFYSPPCSMQLVCQSVVCMSATLLCAPFPQPEAAPEDVTRVSVNQQWTLTFPGYETGDVNAPPSMCSVPYLQQITGHCA